MVVTRPDRGARGGRAALLLQGDRGRKSVDGVDCGNGELVKETAGVGRDGFEVAALRLRVERAEGERGFARAGDAGEDHQRVAGDVHVQVAKIVLAGAADPHHAVALKTGFQALPFEPLEDYSRR